MAECNSHTWTIPLHVSISLGQPRAEPREAESPALPAPSPEGLFRREESDVFGDAADHFTQQAFTTDTFSWQAALNAALCSRLAYDTGESVRTMLLEKWQFESCQAIAADNTECFVASTPRTVVVSFRGTQQTADWLINLNVVTQHAAYGHVHRGFYRALQSVRRPIEDELAKVQARQKHVVLTGHSLGGALATIGAAEWHGEFERASVYTFGQPAVGLTNFKSYMRLRYADTFYRLVNDDDIVARVPPRYRHVGRLYHFRRGRAMQREAFPTGRLDETMTRSEFHHLQDRLRAARAVDPMATDEALEARLLQEGFFPSVADHHLDRYLEQILRQITAAVPFPEG
jgi:hypothetical protein